MNFTRGRSIRSAGVLYDIQVDGKVVGRLKRGERLSHTVEPGSHDVKALFAKTGWQIPDPKTSPTTNWTVEDEETLTLDVSLGAANAPGMAANAAEDDWLVITEDGGAAGDSKLSIPATVVLRLIVAVVMLGAFFMSLVFRAGSTGRTVSQITLGIASVALAYLLYRHFRRLAWGARD